MNNIAKYLEWRGDIPFGQVPCNEVDAYILAKIGVPDFSGIIPSNGPGITLKEAYSRYFSRTDIDPDYFGRLNQPILGEVLQMLPSTVRFGGLILSDYFQKRNDANTEQISALTISLPGGPTVVTFRGTDDTIIGWKENFLMSIRNAVPAQRDAAAYLKRIARETEGPLAVMGHSKGGNLAVYAAATVPETIQDRIIQVYNFDGPGFRPEFWTQPGILRIEDRIGNYVSQHTMVGTLLTRSDRITICRSKKNGPLAHEAMFWEVMGPAFVREKKLSAFSVEFERLLDRQIAQMGDEEIAQFIEDFFGVLTSTGATTLTELAHQSPDQLRRILKEIDSTESIKEFGKDLFGLLYHDTKRLPSVLNQLRRNRRDEKQ